MNKKTAKREKIIWPSPDPIIVKNFLQTGVNLLQEKIGALSQDQKNPLSRVCVANSCFSLEPVRGCPLRCAYCIAGNDCRNLIINKSSYHKKLDEINTKKLIPRKPEILFSGKLLAQTLVKHPGFIKNKSIISVAIGSSEAFLPGVEQETWAAMKYIANHNLTNPFWFAVKYGIHNSILAKWQKRFSYLVNKKIKILISVSESSAPSWLEPYQGNRFNNLDKIAKTGVHISHHLRPIIRGITDSENSLKESLKKSLDLVESICVGGLRIDPGIVLLWKHINKQDPGILPKFSETEKGLPPKKDLPPKIFKKVEKIIKQSGKNIPVYLRSSNALSQAFSIPDVNLYDFRVEDDSVFLKIPTSLQKKIEIKHRSKLSDSFQNIANSIGLTSIKFKINKDMISLNKKLNYPEHRLLIHAISHSEILTNIK